jgi:hypothetical protein
VGGLAVRPGGGGRGGASGRVFRFMRGGGPPGAPEPDEAERDGRAGGGPELPLLEGSFGTREEFERLGKVGGPPLDGVLDGIGGGGEEALEGAGEGEELVRVGGGPKVWAFGGRVAWE